MKSEAKRLDYLDSIRGISALVVLLHHCWLGSTLLAMQYGLGDALSSFTGAWHYAIAKLLAGRAAVMIFFVLSGFVLTYSLERHPASYKAFAIKRFMRIYPAFLFAVIFAYTLHCVIGIRHVENNTFLSREVINPDLSMLALTKHLLMWGTIQGKRIDGVIWSLVHEMRISLLFPIILLTVHKYKIRAVAIYAVISLICTLSSFLLTGQLSTGNEEVTFLGSVLATGYFVVFFATGSWIATERERIATGISALPRWQKIAMFLSVALCIMKTNHDFMSLSGLSSDYIIGIGAAGVICLALGVMKFRTVLNHDLPIWLGRISYSLYLIHFPIQYVVTQTFGAHWYPLESATVVVVLSLLAAELMVRFIERPSMNLGKRLAA